MSRRWPVILGLGALGIIGVSVGLLAMWRVKEARDFAEAYRVRSYDGTNYTVRLVETTVGKVATGYVVVVYARFENPNATELVLKREWFVLMDHDKDYYQPTVGGTQASLIKVPANGVLQKEPLSFAVGDDAVAGALALTVGHHYFVQIKSDKPWTRRLKDGQFVTYRTLDW